MVGIFIHFIWNKRGDFHNYDVVCFNIYMDQIVMNADGQLWPE